MKSSPNPWKLATLGFAVGIVVVGGTAMFQAADAAPISNREALQAIGMVETAQRQLWRAPKDPENHRLKAIEATKLAVAELKLYAMPMPSGSAAAGPPIPPSKNKK